MENIRLNKGKNISSVNEDIYKNLNLISSSKQLIETDISRIIDISEVFINEKNNGSKFRISSTINPLFTNVLSNITGPDSLSSFNEDRFRNKISPANAALNLKENISFANSLNNFRLNKNGWVGYYNPLLLSNDCKLIDLHPKRSELNLLGNGGVKNWDICITYPFISDYHPLVENGLPINSLEYIEYNGRTMVRFSSIFNHGLKTGDIVFLSGFSDPNLDNEYLVYKVGLSDGSKKDNYFVVDINQTISLSPLTTLRRVVNGKKSTYYFRVFKKIKTSSSMVIEPDDYEIFQMGFSNNIFSDNIIQVNFNEDIDTTDLIDNLKRPLTEIFITMIKKSDNMFSSIKSGFNLNLIDEINSNIPDVRRITNNISSNFSFLENDININQDLFYGDLVEFNDYELNEIILNEVNHRFNTNNRDNGGFLNTDGGVINLGKRYEGYFYKPHHSIKIREISEYIEQGSLNDDLPAYAVNLGDGRFLWRDVFEFGNSLNLDIPFLNGCHYINRLINLYLFRQDPFGDYGLYYNTFPRDIVGNLEESDFINNSNEDEC